MNSNFQFEMTKIQGLYLITPFWAEDLRGSFIKDYSKEIFEQKGLIYDLQEVFYTVSHKGVIRALHFQREKQQPKLVRCIEGRIYDVVADLRKDSPTFQKWAGFELAGNSGKELLIPAGCAHGYLVLEHAIVSYKCSEKFYAEFDDGVIWNDPILHVNWPLEEIGGQANVILAEKDRQLQTMDEFLKKYGGF